MHQFLLTRFSQYRAVAAYLKVVRRKKSSSSDGTRGGRAREGDFPSYQGGGGGGGGVGGLPRENFEFLALLCAFVMVFYAFWTRFQSRFFARKDISWRVRKPNAKQNRFQIVTIFFFTFFLQHISWTSCHLCSRRFWQSTFSTDPWLSLSSEVGVGQGVGTP